MALPLADNVVFVNANDCNLPRPLCDIDLNTVSKSLSIYVMRYSKKEKIVFVVSVFLDLIPQNKKYIHVHIPCHDFNPRNSNCLKVPGF